MKKKKEILVIVGSLLVIILSVTLAYFTVQIIGKGKDISLDSANLKITFASGGGNISSTNIEPGWSSGTSTFTVKNESKDTYKYNIIIKDLINTFVTKGFLLYKITSTDGGYNMSDFVDVPKSTSATDTILAYSVEIAKGVTHTYTVEFKYLTSEEDQSDDMGRILSGTLYIEKGTVQPTLAEKLMEDNPTIQTRSSFSAVFTTTNTGTLYKATESIAEGTAKDVYYFAGDAKNNWVKFGDFYWRIIRTNHDGSIRMLYSGTSTDTTRGYIGGSKFNSSCANPKYVGYMYGTGGSLSESRINSNDSTIKTYIDNWYSTNLSSYTKYISTEAVYCNDRQLDSGQSWTFTTSPSSQMNYITYTRLDYNTKGAKANPTYDCANIKDAFSGSNSEAKLTYPIGLMTADEVVFAGGKAFNNAPAYYYLNSTGGSITGSTYWWSLSPMYWDGHRSFVWNVNGSSYPGYLGGSRVNGSVGARPAISIKGDALWSSGNGSSSSPYEIVYN